MAFSKTLKKLREERNISQKDIALYLGVTRQAVASYESGKREPDYEVLKKLGDFFDVSIDYLLGRSNCKDINALTVGRNIELIRGGMSFKDLSQDISNKTGALVFDDMLELYEKGDRMPFAGTVKILAKYAEVYDSFFYTHNTRESFERERNIYKTEMEQEALSESSRNGLATFANVDIDLVKWVLKEGNHKYIALAKDIKDAGLDADALRPLINSFKNKQG